MPNILKPLQWIYSVYAFLLFISIMLLLFPFMVIASFFGPIRGGNAIFFLCMVWCDLWFPLVFIRCRRIFETPHDKRKPYIFITNHNSYLDACVLPKAYRQPIRTLGKIEMSKIPVFGFIYKKVIVTVDRSNAANRVRSVRILKSVLLKGISVLVFPEGTFNMTSQPLNEFYDGAFRIAIETQTPLKPVLFLDDYDRLQYGRLFSLNPGKCRIVYLDEISVEGLTIKDAARLKQKVFEVMSDKLREYNVSWIGRE